MTTLKSLIKTISDYCISSDIDDFSDNLYELLIGIKAPDSLRGISAVLNQLENFFEIHPKRFINGTGLYKEQLNVVRSFVETPGAVEAIRENSDQFHSLQIAKNWMSERPVYSLLLACEVMKIKNENYIKNHYQILVSEFLLHDLSLDEGDKNDIFIKGIMEAARGVRLSLRDKLFDDLSSWESIDGFLTIAKEYRQEGSAKVNHDNYLRGIIQFFEGTRTTHVAGESSLEKHKKQRLEKAKQLPNIDDDEVKISTFICESTANDDGLLYEDSCNAIAYAHVTHGTSKKELSVHPVSVANEKRRKAQSVGISANVIKANNKSLMSPSVLQIHQLYYLFSALMSVSNSNKQTQLKVPKKLIVLTLFLSIYLNKSIKELKELKIGNTIPGNGIVNIDGEIFFSFAIKAKVKTTNENREERCVLPVPKYWCPYILSYHNDNVENESPLIPVQFHGDIEAAVAAFINKLERDNDIAISLSSINSLLSERYQVKSSADLTAITFAFDLESHHTRVKSFYTLFDNAYDISQVINLMWRELELDIQAFKGDFAFPLGFYKTKGSISSKPIGSVFCPDLQLKEVCAFVRRLKESLDTKDSFTIKSNIKNLVEYHNSYVLYVSQMLLYCTGYRAIYDALPRLENVNFRHSVITITDKDYQERISTRIIPLAKVFIEQIKLYLSHLEAILPHLTIYEPSVFKQIYSVSSPTLAPNLSDFAKHGPLFKLRLKANGELVSDVINPSWLKNEGQIEKFSMFTNSGRHLLRTYLTKYMKNQELVDYFTGHADYGASPFEIKSSFNINDAKKKILPYIESLMEACQWQAIKSKIA